MGLCRALGSEAWIQGVSQDTRQGLVVRCYKGDISPSLKMYAILARGVLGR